MHRVGISALILFLGGAAWALASKAPAPPRRGSIKRVDTPVEPRKTGPHFERRTLLADARRRPWTAAVQTSPIEASDPFERAVWAPHQTEGFVVEVSVLLHSAMADAFKGCRRLQQQRLEMEEAFEIDLLYDVDRLGVAETGAVFSGRFRSLRRRLEGEDHETYGEAIIFEHQHRTMALWRDELLLLDQAVYNEVIDRIEGRAPAGPARPALQNDVLRALPPPEFVRRTIFGGALNRHDAIPNLQTEVTMRATWPPVVTVHLRASGHEQALFALVDGPAFDSLRTLRGPLKMAVAHVETTHRADGVELELHLKPDLVLRGFGCAPARLK